MAAEKRRHLRLPLEAKVFIELVSPQAGSADSGDVAVCRSVDVSMGGLRVHIGQALTIGAILQIGVEFPEANLPLYLAGEVRWCRAEAAQEDTWVAGFALMEAAGSDIESWRELLREMRDGSGEDRA